MNTIPPELEDVIKNAHPYARALVKHSLQERVNETTGELFDFGSLVYELSLIGHGANSVVAFLREYPEDLEEVSAALDSLYDILTELAKLGVRRETH